MVGNSVGLVEIQDAAGCQHDENTDDTSHAPQEQFPHEQRGADNCHRERERTQVPAHPGQGTFEVGARRIDGNVLGGLETTDEPDG